MPDLQTLPQMGALFIVANPGPTHALLQGERGEFIRAEGRFWFLKVGNMLQRFPAYDPDKGAANAILPFTLVREGDWVEIDPDRVLAKHRDLRKSPLLVEDVDPTTVIALVDGDVSKAVELAHTEIRVIKAAPAIDKSRYQRRLELENQAKIGFRDMLVALAELRESELWKDATDADGYAYASFTDYCQGVLGIEKTQAHNRAIAGTVLNSLAGVPESQQPRSVISLVELNRVEPEQRPAVLSAVADSGKQPTREAIREAATPAPPQPKPDRHEPDPEPPPVVDSRSPASHEATVKEWLQQALSLIGVEGVLDILEELAPEAFE